MTPARARWSNNREKLDVLKEQNDVIQNRSKIEAEIERNIDRHLRDIEAKMVGRELYEKKESALENLLGRI
ncbi:conserved hypothetical protein [Culex quinquefasciatus]|uniref:Uncharacterized protein n=1 Tax=Culex quinquefasciatus TaxID=7176 RepID=B0WGI1_CULQU|nr:conserved hypothetical protein [Culex quinquefasciatus]|eukprot:XP_001847814.1 conserved hypothetical protein [Culex quinquefasciatus]